MCKDPQTGSSADWDTRVSCGLTWALTEDSTGTVQTSINSSCRLLQTWEVKNSPNAAWPHCKALRGLWRFGNRFFCSTHARAWHVSCAPLSLADWSTWRAVGILLPLCRFDIDQRPKSPTILILQAETTSNQVATAGLAVPMFDPQDDRAPSAAVPEFARSWTRSPPAKQKPSRVG